MTHRRRANHRTNHRANHLRQSPAPTLFASAWKVAVIVIIYLLRTGLMNCTYPITSSITMDFVPTSKRAQWQSLGSIVRFGWAGARHFSSCAP
jgi:hypothetical protein